MNSMTGFGRGAATVGPITATAELRSVNNRFLEAATRLPRAVSDHETDVQNLLRGHFDRGRFTVNVQLDAASADLPLRVNAEVARAYTNLLSDLAAASGLNEPVTLDHLLRYPDVFTNDAPDDESAEDAWAATRQALAVAIDEMKTTRRQEGEALRADLDARLDTIEKAVEQVEVRAPERVTEARTRLAERLADVLADTRVQPERIEQEIALLADRLDVTEECVRLRAHLTFFRDALNATEPAGRRLNFLVQEIGREVNTIGSKANDTETAHLAVAMKEEMEKIREQVQNVE